MYGQEPEVVPADLKLEVVPPGLKRHALEGDPSAISYEDAPVDPAAGGDGVNVEDGVMVPQSAGVRVGARNPPSSNGWM